MHWEGDRGVNKVGSVVGGDRGVNKVGSVVRR